MTKTSFLSFAVGAVLLLSTLARADTLNLSLIQPLQFGAPGSILNFNATAHASATNGATLFLNGASSTIDFPLTLNDDGFFLGFPFSLEPGESFTGLLFSVTLPSDVTLNSLFNGSFQILGGGGADDFGILASVNFQVSTAAGPGGPIGAVPEPSTYGFLGAGLLGIVVIARRRAATRRS